MSPPLGGPIEGVAACMKTGQNQTVSENGFVSPTQLAENAFLLSIGLIADVSIPFGSHLFKVIFARAADRVPPAKKEPRKSMGDYRGQVRHM